MGKTAYGSASIVEAYKTIRTRLISVLGDRSGCRTVTVSSPCLGEGKTTTAINIAIAFSQLGKRVLLIDADMRNSAIRKRLKLSCDFGLAELLNKSCTFDRAIVNAGAYFDVILAGRLDNEPESLLSSDDFESLLSGLRLAYDYIVIDSPSICDCEDTLYIAQKTDGVVLVVREGETLYKNANRAIGILDDAGILLLGTVLNACKKPEGI